MASLYSVAVVLVAFLLSDCHARPTPYLDAVQTSLKQVAPRGEGKVWKLTRGNTLKPGWLLQTPNCWGDADVNKNCARHNTPGAHALADQMRNDIASAKQWVDITTLADDMEVATGIFHEAIVQGIKQALARHPNVTVRILGGTPPSKSDGVAKVYMNKLMKDLGSDANGARIFVAGIEPMQAYSWNHAKMVTVDGRTAIVGGHNLVDEAYNGDHPVSDVSMRVEGPAAASAHAFADLLWNFACEKIDRHKDDDDDDYYVEYAAFPGVADTPCPKDSVYVPPLPLGDVSILAVGMLGMGVDSLDNTDGAPRPANDDDAACSAVFDDSFNDDKQFIVDSPDLEARRVLIKSAKKHVFLAQQDLIFDFCDWWNSAFVSAYYDARLFDVLAGKLEEGVPVTIVVSTPLDKGDSAGFSYMNSLQEIPKVLLHKLQQRNTNQDVAKEIICKYLKLAAVRIARNMSTWDSGVVMGQHAKVIAVDDAAFYIGSHNLYPTTLQEFGYIVEDTAAAQHLKVEFLDKLWYYSKESAIIDPESGICNFAQTNSKSTNFMTKPTPNIVLFA